MSGLLLYVQRVENSVKRKPQDPDYPKLMFYFQTTCLRGFRGERDSLGGVVLRNRESRLEPMSTLELAFAFFLSISLLNNFFKRLFQ